MSLSIFVNDGMTVWGKTAAVPGLYPEVRYRYRPAVPETRAEYSEAQARDKVRVGAAIIARQVQELRVEGTDEPVILRAEQAAKLHAELFQSILFACLGFTGPDVEDGEKNSVTASTLNSPTPG